MTECGDFYNDDLTGFNFRRAKTSLDSVLADLERASRDAGPPAIYVAVPLGI